MSTSPVRPTLALVAAAAAIVAGTIAAAPDADSRPARPSIACPSEDSSWCVWDARHNGNGHGRSFWSDRDGTPHYVTHARAHAMVTR